MTSHASSKSAHLRRREVDAKKNLSFIRNLDELLDKESTDTAYGLSIEFLSRREKKTQEEVKNLFGRRKDQIIIPEVKKLTEPSANGGAPTQANGHAPPRKGHKAAEQDAKKDSSKKIAQAEEEAKASKSSKSTSQKDLSAQPEPPKVGGDYLYDLATYKRSNGYEKFLPRLAPLDEEFDFNVIDYEATAKDIAEMKRRAPALRVEDFERLVDIFEKQTNFADDIPPLALLEPAIAKHAKGTATRDQAEAAYAYWQQERLRSKQPFLRAFWRKPNREDSNSNLVFRSRTAEKMNLRKKAKNEQDSYAKARDLRADLCAQRSLVQKLIRREILKGFACKLELAEFREKTHAFTAEESRQLTRDEAALRPRLPEALRPDHADAELVPPPPRLEPPPEPVEKKPREKPPRIVPPEPEREVVIEQPPPRVMQSERVICSQDITEITKLLAHASEYGCFVDKMRSRVHLQQRILSSSSLLPPQQRTWRKKEEEKKRAPAEGKPEQRVRGDLEYFVFVGRCGIVKCKRVGSGRFGAFREKRDEGRRLLGKRAFPGSDEGATIVVSSGEEEYESEVEECTRRAIEELRSKLKSRFLKKHPRKIAGENSMLIPTE